VRLHPDIRFVRGTVLGEPGSIVVLGWFHGGMAGFVRTQGNEFGIRPSR